MVVIFSAPTKTDRTLYDESEGANAHISNPIWYFSISKSAYGNDAYKMGYITWRSRSINALKAAGYASPVSPTPEAANDIDITSSGLVLVARDTSIGTTDPQAPTFATSPYKTLRQDHPQSLRSSASLALNVLA